MKLSCTNTMLSRGTLTEKALALRQWGYDGISVFLDYGDWSPALREEVLALPGRTGLEICEFAFEGAPHGHGRLMDRDPELRARARRLYREAVEICVQLGAVTEIEFEYRAQSPLPMLHPYQKMPPDLEREFLDMYAELAAAAAGSRASVLIEPINRYESPYLNCTADALEIVEKLGRPNTGLLLDFFHLSIEERDIAESLRLAGGHLKHVHLGDNNRLLPGYGRLDWAAYLAVLKEVGYQGYLNLECSTSGLPEKTLPETAGFLRNLIEATSTAPPNPAQGGQPA